MSSQISEGLAEINTTLESISGAITDSLACPVEQLREQATEQTVLLNRISRYLEVIAHYKAGHGLTPRGEIDMEYAREQEKAGDKNSEDMLKFGEEMDKKNVELKMLGRDERVEKQKKINAALLLDALEYHDRAEIASVRKWTTQTVEGGNVKMDNESTYCILSRAAAESLCAELRDLGYYCILGNHATRDLPMQIEAVRGSRMITVIPPKETQWTELRIWLYDPKTLV